MPRINRLGKKFQIYSDAGIQSHFQNLAQNIEIQANVQANRDVRIHCNDQIIVTANKFILACASKFLCSIFSSKCDCASERTDTFDLVCPSFHAEAMKKVLDMLTGNECYIKASNHILYEEIKSILLTLDIKIELPQIDLDIMDQEVVLDDHDDLEESFCEEIDNQWSPQVDLYLEDNSVDKADSKPALLQKYIICEYCDKAFTSSTFLDKHIQSHFQARQSGDSNIVNYTLTKDVPQTGNNFTVSKSAVPYQCELCSKEFVLKLSLDQHREKKHYPSETTSNKKVQFNPAMTMDTMLYVETMNNNISSTTELVLPYTCESCGKGFTLKIALDSHLNKKTCFSKCKTENAVDLSLLEKQAPNNNNNSTSGNDNREWYANELSPNKQDQEMKEKKKKLKRTLLFDDFDDEPEPQKKEKRLQDGIKVYRCHLCPYEDLLFNSLGLHLATNHYMNDMNKLFENKKPWKCNLCDKISTTKNKLILHLVQRHKALDNSVPTKKSLTVYLDEDPASLHNATEGKDPLNKSRVLESKKLSTPSITSGNIELKHSTKVIGNEGSKKIAKVIDSNNYSGMSKSSECTVIEIKDSSKSIDTIEVERTAEVSGNANVFQANVPDVEVTNVCRIYKCPMCEERTTKSMFLLKHMAMEHFKDKLMSKYGKDSQWQCGECKENFQEEDSLVNHLMNTHKALKSIMSIQAFLERRSAKSPSAAVVRSENVQASIEAKEPSFPCPNCNNSFPSYLILQTHAAMIHYEPKLRPMCGDKKWDCRLCQIVFSTKPGLFCHLATRHGALNGLLPDQATFTVNQPSSDELGKSIDVIKTEKSQTLLEMTQEAAKTYISKLIPKHLTDSGVNLEPVVVLETISKKTMESLNSQFYIVTKPKVGGEEQPSTEFQTQYQCHICRLILDSHENVLNHYGNIHYKHKLMNFYGNKDQACSFCIEYLPR